MSSINSATATDYMHRCRQAGTFGGRKIRSSPLIALFSQRNKKLGHLWMLEGEKNVFSLTVILVLYPYDD